MTLENGHLKLAPINKLVSM